MISLNPSLYQLPQNCSSDRKRARKATLAFQRTQYRLTLDPALSGSEGDATKRLFLPPHLVDLPSREKFSPKKWAIFLLNSLRVQANGLLMNVALDFGLSDYRGYAGLSRIVNAPEHPAMNWRCDAEFARQRLAGCNPMQLRRCDGLPSDDFRAPVQAVLNELHEKVTLEDVMNQGRLFEVSYPELAHPLVQASAPRDVWVAVPTALFYASPRTGLVPLAIQLKQPGASNNPVFTPLGRREEWLYARCQVQAADCILHESVHHLLNTHLVSEICAVACARQLHPDHPVSQLLTPHFQFTLAINDLARRTLLTYGGPIDRAIGSGLDGALAVAAQQWSGWDFWKQSPMHDMERRGVDSQDVLPDYHFRDDAVALWTAMYEYVRDITTVWYVTDADVQEDEELQAWAAEIAAPDGGRVPGFPARIENLRMLHLVLTEILFRASAMHAAVNNGQYERYGWIPYSPSTLHAPPQRGPDSEPFDEYDLWWCMPNREQARGQMDMAWILSAPTMMSLVRTGEVPAFDPDLNPQAALAVGTFRRRLREISASIRRRNKRLQKQGKVPYTYLDPHNIARSIEV